jgi:signal transduction histidine kinase
MAKNTDRAKKLLRLQQQLERFREENRTLHQHLRLLQKELNGSGSKRVSELRRINRQLQLEIRERQQAETILRKRTHQLGERVKELNCLYAVSRLLAQRGSSLEELLQKTVELIPPAWQYPEITCARAIVEDRSYQTPVFRKTRWRQECPIRIDGRLAGQLEVCYLARRPVQDEGPFLKEERNLLAVLAERIGPMVKQSKAEEALLRQQQLLELSERNLKSFSRRILQVREEEKRKLALELHDRLGTMVVALDSRLSLAEHELGDASPALAQVRETRRALQSSVEGLKRIARGLRPPDLDILGLPSALRHLAEDFAQKTRLQITCRISAGAPPPPPPGGIVLYRVAQEALTNIFKHARARQVQIRLGCRQRGLWLSVRDDGIGFDPAPLLHCLGGKHMGLRGMQEQLELAGGSFSLNSKPGAGTEICAHIPYSEKHGDEHKSNPGRRPRGGARRDPRHPGAPRQGHPHHRGSSQRDRGPETGQSHSG